MRIQVLDEAEDDLPMGRQFYDRQEPGVGAYFAAALASDIDSLILFAGIHPQEFGFHRALSKRFPFGIYYLVEEELIRSTSDATRPGFAADWRQRNSRELRCGPLRPHIISNPRHLCNQWS